MTFSYQKVGRELNEDKKGEGNSAREDELDECLAW